jgi:Flp pilus assembly protein TadD
VRVNLASALAQTGRLAEAETLYVEVLDVDPANAAARENLAKVRAALGARP